MVGFEGTIDGQSKDLTTIWFRIPSSVCKFVPTAGIEISGGNVALRTMTLDFTGACNEDINSNIINYGVHFTSPGYGACDQRVVFGKVDRVVIRSNLKPSFWTHGIGVKKHQSCGTDDRLLGSFKLNRSEISGFVIGLLTEMVSGAQVDVNFNKFSGHYQALLIENSNQNMGVYQNVFYMQDLTGRLENWKPVGIELNSRAESTPARTKISIHKNTFIDETKDALAVPVTLRGRDGVKVSTAITSNTFHSRRDPGSSSLDIGGIAVWDVDGGFISSNRFEGETHDFVHLSGNDWSIVSNNFKGTALFCDIRITGNGNLVGSQSAYVCADGEANIVAPQ
ncbi:MAG: hypothetical protein GXP23_10545 [Gammaproteobacteria bacterium]|nr:hypothetical protein [Gammaproteobacteria bacterium]